jgi:hypothetical protein
MLSRVLDLGEGDEDQTAASRGALQNSGTTNQWLFSVCFVDSMRGWVVGFDHESGLGASPKTADGGAT